LFALTFSTIDGSAVQGFLDGDMSHAVVGAAPSSVSRRGEQTTSPGGFLDQAALRVGPAAAGGIISI